MSAMVPLYVAMILAYGSVRWWKIFTPDQCSGINRFVAIFAVPLLSFHFISMNDPYAMNFRFIAADTLQKIIMLFYRGAKMLIMEQFPETGASIVSFKVESDVVSLDGHDFLETDAEIGNDGKLHVTVRKSNASRRSLGIGSVSGMTPRPSNLTGAEIYSLSSSRNQTPRGSNFNHSDFYSMMGFPGGRLSNFGPADAYSVQTSRGPTPRPSNFEESTAPGPLNMNSPRFGFYPAAQAAPASYPGPNPEITSTAANTTKSQQSKTQQQQNNVSQNKANQDAKELHMFVWSSNASPVSEGGLQVYGGNDFGSTTEQPGRPENQGPKEIKMTVSSDLHQNGETKEDFTFGGDRDGGEEKDKEGQTGLNKLASSSTAELHPKGIPIEGKQMPPASVMTRLILIMVWRKLIRNPNTYSSLIGLIWSLVSFRWHVAMPKIIEKSIAILSDAGLGMAMFSLVASFAMAVRFLTGPAVMAAASIAVGLRGTLLHIAIVQAALPQGIVPFVFAKEYNVHPAILSTAVIFGMLIALPITLVYYIILGL
ncbi:hypothetical protein M8C21_013535 [Ambrosia artemisiifolia]|uniref:Auxin efflux carrier component n=1 Tax=Ambrosia artemisiifolia TaxID=4212 RepID=A0AAD5G875_AMBAR|nr:hypothetical protein M8C21_013535 [Ambrosia artemisiifolia]